jgi:hypothetical protein
MEIGQKELVILNYARDYNNHIIRTPPHANYKLQSLDQRFMEWFRTAYSKPLGLWMRKPCPSKHRKRNLQACCHLDVVRSGFTCTAVHRSNPGIFTELEFLPSQLYSLLQTNARAAKFISSESSQNTNCKSFQETYQLPPGLKVSILKNCHHWQLLVKNRFQVPGKHNFTWDPYKAAWEKRTQWKVTVGRRGKNSKAHHWYLWDNLQWTREKGVTPMEKQQLKYKIMYIICIEILDKN